jgi:hypothetical protein
MLLLSNSLSLTTNLLLGEQINYAASINAENSLRPIILKYSYD